MTRENALFNASMIHMLMLQIDELNTVCFDTYNSTNECIVYAHYNPSKVKLDTLKETFSLPAIKDAYFEDRELEGLTNCIFSFTWLWDDETSGQPSKRKKGTTL